MGQFFPDFHTVYIEPQRNHSVWHYIIIYFPKLNQSAELVSEMFILTTITQWFLCYFCPFLFTTCSHSFIQGFFKGLTADFSLRFFGENCLEFLSYSQVNLCPLHEQINDYADSFILLHQGQLIGLCVFV